MYFTTDTGVNIIIILGLWRAMIKVQIIYFLIVVFRAIQAQQAKIIINVNALLSREDSTVNLRGEYENKL